MRNGLIHGRYVVVTDLGNRNAGGVTVDKNQRKSDVNQFVVGRHVCRGVGVRPRHDDDPGDLTRLQNPDVVILTHATGGLGTHRSGVPLPREQGLNGLGVAREDRISEFRNDEPHQAGSDGFEMGGALIPQYVEGGEDTLPGGARYSRLVVEDSRDGRLAYARLIGNISQSWSAHISSRQRVSII